MENLNNRKIPMKVIVSYMASSFGTNSLWMLNNYFLLFFYTDVVKIPAAAATVILLVARVWDAVNDPMMGVLCDRTKSKEGKSRYWLKRMAIPAGVCVALSYCCPNWATPAKIAWVSVTYIFQGMAQTAIGVPLSALRATMTTNRIERTKLSQYMAVPSALANFVIPAVTMPFVKSFGDGKMGIGFAIIALIIGMIYAISTLVVWWGTKGFDKDTSSEQSVKEQENKVSAIELLKDGFRNKYCMIVCATYCTYLLLSGIMGGTMIYYFTYNLQNENLMAVYSSVAVVANFAAILMMRVMGKKFGNAVSCMLAGVVCAVGFILRAVFGDNTYLVFVAGIACLGLGGGFFSHMIHQCILDATTYGRLRGMDNPSVVMSLFTFAQKFGQALSSVIASALLAVFHYTPGEQPGEQVLKLFYFENIIFPIIVAAVMMILLYCLSKMEKQLVHDMERSEKN